MRQQQQQPLQRSQCRVFICAQTPFTYAKTEGLADAGLQAFTLLLSAKETVAGFTRQLAVQGAPRLRLRRAGWPLALDTAPQVFIHARDA